MSNEIKYNEGDFVQLKAGGPVMNVTATIDDKNVNCIWFDKDDRYNEHPFPNSCLIAIDGNDIEEFGGDDEEG